MVHSPVPTDSPSGLRGITAGSVGATGLWIGATIVLLSVGSGLLTHSLTFHSFGEGLYGRAYYDTYTLAKCLKFASVLA